jgi:hypothetical protein
MGNIAASAMMACMNLKSGDRALNATSKRNKELCNVKKNFENSYLSFPLIICFYFLLFPQASFAVEKPKQSPRISVVSRPFADNEKAKYTLQVRQPYRFAPKTIMKAMSSLAYQNRGVSWSNKRRVFTTATIRELAPRIVAQFSRVTPDERVFFQLKNASGKTLLRGDTFIADDGMHWRLTVIQRERRKIDGFSISGHPWRLVPRRGQAYKSKQRYKGLIEEISNWIVIKKIRPEPARILPLLPSRPQNAISDIPKRLKIKERLKILENLKQEGLVDGEEYKNKRREILKDL